MSGTPIRSVRDYRVGVARLEPAAPVTLDVWRGGERLSITLSAAPPAPAAERPLGLRLQTIARVGSEIVIVDANSAAALAGLRPGDVIVTIGDIAAPSPAQIVRVYERKAGAVLVGIRRGAGHRVVALD
jgi:S1-C subfamily serine protease